MEIFDEMPNVISQNAKRIVLWVEEGEDNVIILIESESKENFEKTVSLSELDKLISYIDNILVHKILIIKSELHQSFNRGYNIHINNIRENGKNKIEWSW